MYEATFELEAITPLFMRGADQRKAEFRSASVKGVMRWWFRALAGNYFGNDIDALRKAEGMVFGSAGSGGARRSRVDVIVNSEEFTPENFPLPMVWNKKFHIRRIKASAIPPGTTFTVVLRSPNYPYLAMASYSLIAMSYFGGLGFRSNRGAGSVRIIDGPDEIMKQLPRSYEQFKMFPNWLIEKFGKHLCSIKKDVSLVKTNNYFSYSVLSQDCSSVWLWEPSESLEDIYYSADENNLLDKFEKEFKGWDGCPFGYKNYVFGLPKPDKKSRRASPMKVGVVVLDGKYWVRISVFKTSMFTQDSSVRVNWNCLYKFLRDVGANKVWPNGRES